VHTVHVHTFGSAVHSALVNAKLGQHFADYDLILNLMPVFARGMGAAFGPEQKHWLCTVSRTDLALPRRYDGQKQEQSKLLQELQQHFDVPTTTWLMREMEENRDKATAAEKLYCCREVHKNAKDKLLVKHAQAHLQDGRHHVIGCEELLARLEEDPGILEPQALLVPN
jgi:hypothetical protein